MAELLTSNITGTLNVSSQANIAGALNVFAVLNVTSNIANTGNLLVTQNTFTGNLVVTTLANITTGNIVTVNANTVNVNTVISLAAGAAGLNLMGGLAASNANVRLWANGVEWLRVTNTGVAIGTAQPNSNLSITGNLYVTTGANVSGTMNAVNMNVSQNIANVGNIAVTQNAVVGNLSVVTLANIATLNVANPIAQFANVGLYAQGTLVANNPNINIIAANTTNLIVTGISNTSPGNVTFSIDLKLPPGGSVTGVPGGTNTMIEFNDSGSFGGNGDFTFDKVNAAMSLGVSRRTNNTGITIYAPITLTPNVLPTTPPANSVTLFSRPMAGRMMPSWIEPTGLHSIIQASLSRNNFGLWDWIGNATTTALALGIVAPVTTGTATARTCSPASFFQSLKRIGYLSAATAGSNACIRTGVAQYWTGNVAGAGGFTYVARFGVSDPAVVPGAMMFIGLSNTIAQIANANNVAAMPNVIGVGQLSNANTLFVVTNNNTSTAALVNTNLLCNVGNTNVWEVILYCPPNSTTVGVSVMDVANIANNFFTTISGNTNNLPAPNTMLAIQQWRTNNTTAAAVGLDFVSTYIETDS